MANIVGDSSDPNVAAVNGTHTNGAGGSAAIIGQSEGRGILGISGAGQGVWGASTSGAGVVGVSESGDGVSASSKSATGVVGVSDQFQGVRGVSHASGHGGVVGTNDNADNGIGVYGLSGSAASGAGVFGENTAATGFAGFFKGHVGVTGNLTVNGDVFLTGADLAEQFSVVGDVAAEPGCVVVLAGDDCVRVSDEAYDRRVAGIVSGAGNYVPALILDRRDGTGRRPLALTGKVWCKVDADCGPVEVGDLLTTSPTPGHAMSATDPGRAFGAVVGKALGSLRSGRGLVPVLVSLQ
jgi:hypothetical protein